MGIHFPLCVSHSASPPHSPACSLPIAFVTNSLNFPFMTKTFSCEKSVYRNYISSACRAVWGCKDILKTTFIIIHITTTIWETFTCVELGQGSASFFRAHRIYGKLFFFGSLPNTNIWGKKHVQGVIKASNIQKTTPKPPWKRSFSFLVWEKAFSSRCRLFLRGVPKSWIRK